MSAARVCVPYWHSVHSWAVLAAAEAVLLLLCMLRSYVLDAGLLAGVCVGSVDHVVHVLGLFISRSGGERSMT